MNKFEERVAKTTNFRIIRMEISSTQQRQDEPLDHFFIRLKHKACKFTTEEEENNVISTM